MARDLTVRVHLLAAANPDLHTMFKKGATSEIVDFEKQMIVVSDREKRVLAIVTRAAKHFLERDWPCRGKRHRRFLDELLRNRHFQTLAVRV